MNSPKAFPCAELTIRSSPHDSGCAARQSWVLAATVLGSTLAFIDESVVNVALPRIESALGTTLQAMQWVVTAYMLCMCALLLIGGAAGDQFGRRRIFLTGVIVFALSSIACGLAPGVSVLVVARAVQGVGAALLVPCSLALIGASFTEKERGAAVGVWSGATALAAGAGPLLGGWLVDQVTWRAIFLINPLLAIPTLWITLAKVPESRNPNAAPAIDWTGGILEFVSLGGLVYALISSAQLGWTHPAVGLSLAASLICSVAFLWVEHRSRWPMMPLELFRSRTFAGVNLMTLLLYGALGGAFFVLPFLLVQAYGWSTTMAGAAYLPFSLVIGVSSRWSGKLLDRFGPRRPLISGPTLAALGLLSLSASGRSASTIVLSMALLGVGMAITAAPLTATVLNSVPLNRAGVASGINDAVATAGSLLTIAMLGAIASIAFNHSLNQHLTAAHASGTVAQAALATHGAFVTASVPTDLTAPEQELARSIITRSVVTTVQVTLRGAAVLAILSALVATITIRVNRNSPGSRNGTPR